MPSIVNKIVSFFTDKTEVHPPPEKLTKWSAFVEKHSSLFTVLPFIIVFVFVPHVFLPA